jgi:hypothetical protein
MRDTSSVKTISDCQSAERPRPKHVLEGQDKDIQMPGITPNQQATCLPPVARLRSCLGACSAFCETLVVAQRQRLRRAIAPRTPECEGPPSSGQLVAMPNCQRGWLPCWVAGAVVACALPLYVWLYLAWPHRNNRERLLEYEGTCIAVESVADTLSEGLYALRITGKEVRYK